MGLKWTKWVDEKDIPLDELILFEIVHDCGDTEFKSGDFTLAGDGGILGIVGDNFHWDRQITRWASIQHLVEET